MSESERLRERLGKVESALALAIAGLDRIARGTWNRGAPERKAAREFARDVLEMLEPIHD